jgi:hypothetical protein
VSEPSTESLRLPEEADPVVEVRRLRRLAAIQLQDLAKHGVRNILLIVKTIRRILNFKESIMKYGVVVPRNDNEADASPEHRRWASGRQFK